MSLATCRQCGFVRPEWVLWPRNGQPGDCPECGHEMSWMGVPEAQKQSHEERAGQQGDEPEDVAKPERRR